MQEIDTFSSIHSPPSLPQPSACSARSCRVSGHRHPIPFSKSSQNRFCWKIRRQTPVHPVQSQASAASNSLHVPGGSAACITEILTLHLFKITAEIRLIHAHPGGSIRKCDVICRILPDPSAHTPMRPDCAAVLPVPSLRQPYFLFLFFRNRKNGLKNHASPDAVSAPQEKSGTSEYICPTSRKFSCNRLISTWPDPMRHEIPQIAASGGHLFFHALFYLTAAMSWPTSVSRGQIFPASHIDDPAAGTHNFRIIITGTFCRRFHMRCLPHGKISNKIHQHTVVPEIHPRFGLQNHQGSGST